MVRHKACCSIDGMFFLLSKFLTIMTWSHPNSRGGFLKLPSFYGIILSSTPQSTLKSSYSSPEDKRIGFGPCKSDISFFNLSIVLGKRISKQETIELASCRMLLWDLKLTVKCFRTGGFISKDPAKILGLNNDFKSQNLKPTPLAIVWAVSPE